MVSFGRRFVSSPVSGRNTAGLQRRRARAPKWFNGRGNIKSRRLAPAAGTRPACGAARGGVDGFMPRIALYPGSFDPVTNGHLDVVRHAVGLCDRLIVAIGVHPGKKPLFSVEERLEMVREVFAPVAASGRMRLRLHHLRQPHRHGGAKGRRHHHDPGPARRHRPRLRDADRRHERNHGAGGPHRFRAGLAAVRPITATLVRQIAGMGGDVSTFVPPAVAAQPQDQIRRLRPVFSVPELS